MRLRETTTATLVVSIAMFCVCCSQAEAKSKMQKQSFGKTEDGQQVDCYLHPNQPEWHGSGHH